jgi:hypothetical protein
MMTAIFLTRLGKFRKNRHFMNMFRVSSVAAVSLAVLLAGCASIENMMAPGTESATPVRAIKNLNDDYIQNATATMRAGVATQQTNLQGRVATYGAIKADITKSAEEYLMLVGQLRAKLQVGTTPGNPQMIALLEQAGATRKALSGRVNDLQNFGNVVSKDISNIGFLAQTIGSAMNLAGGTEADRTTLQQMGLEANRIGQDYLVLMQDVNLMITHQKTMAITLDGEYEELTALVRQGVNSNPLAAQSFQLSNIVAAAPAAMAATESPAAVTTPSASSAPLATSTAAQASTIEQLANKEVLFAVSKSERRNGFEQALYDAVSKAYASDQNIKFHVLGVSPIGATAAETSGLNDMTNAEMEAVLKAMVDMGVPVSRVTLEVANSSKVDEPEVRLYKQ